MLANIAKIPKGAIVLVSQGANDTANAMKAAEQTKKPPRDPKQIAANVANVVNKVQAQGATVIFMLFPNGPGRGPGLAKYYGGDYQEDVRNAIKSAIGNVEIIDINGKPLTDGVHATMGVYKEVASQTMNKAKSQVAAPVGGKPTTGQFSLEMPTKNKGPEVADLQKALIALGFPLPKHGVDGIRGPETSAAIRDFQKANNLPTTGSPDKQTIDTFNAILASKPEILSKLKKSTDADVKPGGQSGKNVDVSAIQDPDFNRKLEKMCKELGVSTKDMIAVMKLESGIDPARRNTTSGATGLIQFMPKTAAALGTTTEALAKMSAVEQLDYVYKYFKMVGLKPGSNLQDLYMGVFMPAAMGKGPDHVLGQRGASGFSGKVYDQNSGLDKNKDGVITVADATQTVQRFA
jgi:hypothetical protein